MPEFSFWGVTCAPLATPSETCLPHRLRITRAVCCAQARSPRFAAVTGPSSTCLQHARPIRAMQVDLRVRGDAWQTLDPAQAANLKPGTRVTIWATQKMRPEQRSGALHPVQAKRALVALLVSAQRESVGTNLFFSSSSLLSFSVSPKSQACAVHLAGYFDHSSDAQPEQVDDGSITWLKCASRSSSCRQPRLRWRQQTQARLITATEPARTLEQVEARERGPSDDLLRWRAVRRVRLSAASSSVKVLPFLKNTWASDADQHRSHVLLGRCLHTHSFPDKLYPQQQDRTCCVYVYVSVFRKPCVLP